MGNSNGGEQSKRLSPQRKLAVAEHALSRYTWELEPPRIGTGATRSMRLVTEFRWHPDEITRAYRRISKHRGDMVGFLAHAIRVRDLATDLEDFKGQHLPQSMED